MHMKGCYKYANSLCSVWGASSWIAIRSVCLSVCGSVRLLAAFGSSAKLCPEHSYAPAKGTSFENGGTKRVKIRLRLSSLSSLNLWFCELVGKDQRWSKYQSVPRLETHFTSSKNRPPRGQGQIGMRHCISCHRLSCLVASTSVFQTAETDQATKVTAVATLLLMAPAAPNSRRPGCWIWSRLHNDGLTLDLTKQY